MIIVNQSRTEVYNFDNIISIKIETGIHIYIREVTQEVGGRYMGSYDTVERAKEVLQEIIETYKENGSVKIDNIQVKNKVVYEMPLK